MSPDLKLAQHHIPSVSFSVPCAFYSSEKLWQYYFPHFTNEELMYTVLNASQLKLSM